MPMSRQPVILVILLLLLQPALAHAHVGIGAGGAPPDGFLAGLSHPFGGIDHLCAMLAVGLWAAQMGQRAVWAAPSSFLILMAIGSLLGASGMNPPFIEQGILLSVLLLGLLITAAVRLPLAASVGLVGLFALCHGFAHGSEMPASASGLAYASGFMLATAALHLLGIGMGLLTRNLSKPYLIRHAGALIAAAGGYLWVA